MSLRLAQLAVIRPDDFDLPLFVHVVGAMALVGALVLALAYLVAAWRGGSAAGLRGAARALLIGALPAFIAMRVGAQWIYDEEGFPGGDDDPNWVLIGYWMSDLGLLVLLIALLVAGIGVRRARRAADQSTVGAGTVRVTAGLVSLLILAYVYTIWAMTTKPA